MKKLLLLLLCVPLMFSCGEDKETKQKDWGCVSGNCEDGFGTYIWTGEYTAGKYIGEWKDGMQHGQGTKTYTNGGGVYTGQWKQGYHHGKGTLTWGDGTIKSGMWRNGDFLGN